MLRVRIGVPRPVDLGDDSSWSVEEFRVETIAVTRDFLEEIGLSSANAAAVVVIEEAEMMSPG